MSPITPSARLWRSLALVSLLFLSLGVGAWQATAQEGRDEPLIIVPAKITPSEKISFSFRGASIDDVLRFMARVTGKIIYKDPAVQMSVTILNQSQVTVDKALYLLSLALSLRDFQMAIDEDAILITSTSNARRSGGLVIVGKDPSALPRSGVVTVVAALEYADVSLVVQQLQPYFPQNQGIITSNPNTNTLIMTDEAPRLRRVLQIIAEIDKDTGFSIETRVFILEYADADTVENIIQDVYQQEERPTQVGVAPAASGQSGQSGQPRRPMGPTASQVRNRVRAEIDERLNAVVVSAAPNLLPGIADLIEQLDVDITPRFAYRQLKLQYADPVSIVDILNQLTDNRGSDSPFQLIFGGGRGARRGSGDSIYGEPRFVPDARTNSIIMSVPIDMLDDLVEFVESLDTEADLGNTVRTFKLQHAIASEVANSLTSLFFGQLQGQGFGFALFGQSSSQPAANAPLELFRQVTIIPHDPTNQLLITAPSQAFEAIKKLIDDLDKSQPQVFIEVVIADITLDSLTRYGISWTAITGQSAFGTDFGLIGPAVDATGFSYSVLSRNYDAILRVLRETNKVNIISTPHVMVSDNTPAVVSIGESIPYAATSSITQGVVQTTIDFQEVAITLNVTPHISPGGEVMLDIDQVVNSLIEFISVGPNQTAPRTTNRHAGTTVTVDDGQTVVIGGIISDEIRVKTQRVPILSQIPIIGQFFRFKEKVKVRSELVVFLTPHIIRKPEEANAIREAQRKRLPLDPFNAGFVKPLELMEFQLNPPGKTPIIREETEKGKRRRRQKTK